MLALRIRRASLGFGRDVAIVLGYGFLLLPIGSGVSVRQILGISGRRCSQSMGMLDGTKMLLASRRNFSNQAEQSVGIGAINTSDPLDGIQIGQHPPIKDQVVFPGNFGNSVDGKADKLVEGNRSVKQQKGKRASVNR